MSGAIKLTLTFHPDVINALDQEAETLHMERAQRAKDIIDAHFEHSKFLTEDRKGWLALYRSLSRRAALKAVELDAPDEFDPRIIDTTCLALEGDAAWMKDYETLIGGEKPDVKGNADKRNINQNLGSVIRIAVLARIKKNDKGVRMTAKAKALILTDFSLLDR